MDRNHLAEGSDEPLCRHSNEPLGSIRGEGYIDHVTDCYGPKRDFVLYSYSFTVYSVHCMLSSGSFL